MDFINFNTEIPDGLPITQAIVDRVRADFIAGEHGLIALQKGITGLLSGLMALEREVNALRNLVSGD